MGIKKHKLRWTLGGGLISLVLFPFFYLYLRGTFQESTEYELTNIPGVEDPTFPLAVAGLSGALPAQGSITGFWVGAEDIYTTRLEAIREAQDSILFETFYMTPGRRADDFAATLAEQAQAGVLIRMIVDDYGTSDMPKEYWQRLESLGIEVRRFSEFDWRAPLTYNSRTHRKLLIIDGERAYIGGAGVSDSWDGDPDIEDRAPWLDYEVRYEGEVVNLLIGKFFQNWAYEGGTIDLSEPSLSLTTIGDGFPMYILDDTSTLNQSAMGMLFQIGFSAAQERIWIGSPYFIPEGNTRQSLLQARKRGIDVRVLTMSQRNDKPIVYQASRVLYGDLLAAGVQICEYQPSMMHAKATLIDNGWASTGSANFDPRSYFHNDELNVSSSHPQLIENVENVFKEAFAESECLSYEQWQERPLTEKLVGQFGLIFKNLL